MAQELACHGCGRPHVSQLGGDLTCSDDCRHALDESLTVARGALLTCGFIQHADIPNLWEKGGVHVSLDQVIREGLDGTLTRHADTLAEIHG